MSLRVEDARWPLCGLVWCHSRWDSAEADGDGAETCRAELLPAVCPSSAAAGGEGKHTERLMLCLLLKWTKSNEWVEVCSISSLIFTGRYAYYLHLFFIVLDCFYWCSFYFFPHCETIKGISCLSIHLNVRGVRSVEFFYFSTHKLVTDSEQLSLLNSLWI